MHTLPAPALLAAGLIVLAACGDGAGTPGATVTPPAPTTTSAVEAPTTPQPADTSGWLVYRDEEHGFEIAYPEEAELIENFTQDVAVEDPGPGTLVRLPTTEGTTLSEKFLFITATDASTEECLPRDDPESVVINGVEAWRGPIAAGMAMHSWSGHAYFLTDGSSCITLNAVLGAVSAGAFADPPEEFDAEAEAAVLDMMVSSFRWLGE